MFRSIIGQVVEVRNQYLHFKGELLDFEDKILKIKIITDYNNSFRMGDVVFQPVKDVTIKLVPDYKGKKVCEECGFRWNVNKVYNPNCIACGSSKIKDLTDENQEEKDEVTIMKIAYQPDFSEELIKDFTENTFAVMVDPNGDSALYYFADLEDYIKNEIGPVTEEDKRLLEVLRKKDIDYVEF